MNHLHQLCVSMQQVHDLLEKRNGRPNRTARHRMIANTGKNPKPMLVLVKNSGAATRFCLFLWCFFSSMLFFLVKENHAKQT
jgi:hypothetical protein